jgi:cytochrome c biogenesis protein CcdA
MRFVKNASSFVLGLVAVAFVGVASAQTAYDPITTAVDWADVVTGIVAIAALVAAVLVVMRGSKMLLRMIRS